ncbi:DUF6600 domain-containing protein [Legionella londiniensis]|uniref:FecR protein n=1 Tax=Legionella londiniensis TaxID=45068 RepID=A0A0W0VS76_9GAMM|nr:DUF6600 domain-containing protein [Legionella londiniensis]KTD22929.1 FecR protein [Legionella londiniensis]STX92963.1 FecR protein [Legionella londiniensis]
MDKYLSYFKWITHLFLAFFLLIAASFTNAALQNDTYPTVARLSYTTGKISFLPAGEKKWVKAILNRPISRGDRVWTARQARLELQLSNAVIRTDSLTSLKVLNLTNKITQVKLTQGSIVIKVQRIKPQHIYELSTPNLAFTFKKPGYYRVDVDKTRNATVITVRRGEGIAYGEKTSFRIRAGLSCRFTGKNLQNRQCPKLPALDNFDRWCMSRDKLLEHVSAKYVSSEVIGYAELEKHGQWKTIKQYGTVWIPRTVQKKWAPYRSGQWIWVSGWGWTWVDEQPWGFAPFHYGRWLYIEQQWAWVPGPLEVEPIYAPALVAFIGGTKFKLQVGSQTNGIAWFPLAPGEVYIPPYQVSQNYFIQVNISNTIINQTYVTNIYNNQNVDIVYQNINVTDGITAVPLSTFVQSEPVANNVVQISEEEIQSAPITQVATVAPEPISVLGTAEATGAIPSSEVLDENTIVKNEPPPEPAPFAEERKLLENNPGIPLTETELQKLQTTDANVTQTAAEVPEAPPAEVPEAPPAEVPEAPPAKKQPPEEEQQQ